MNNACEIHPQVRERVCVQYLGCILIVSTLLHSILRGSDTVRAPNYAHRRASLNEYTRLRIMAALSRRHPRHTHPRLPPLPPVRTSPLFPPCKCALPHAQEPEEGEEVRERGEGKAGGWRKLSNPCVSKTVSAHTWNNRVQSARETTLRR